MEVHEKCPSLQTTDVKRKYVLKAGGNLEASPRRVSDKREGNKQTEHRRLLTALCHDQQQGMDGFGAAEAAAQVGAG